MNTMLLHMSNMRSAWNATFVPPQKDKLTTGVSPKLIGTMTILGLRMLFASPWKEKECGNGEEILPFLNLCCWTGLDSAHFRWHYSSKDAE